MNISEFMTTHEVAAYLRIKERKVYELVRQRRIPCSRVTGKCLFPKTLVDLWVLQHTDGLMDVKVPPRRLPVITGSHDPLLEWAAREAGCELGVMFNGSLEGLARFAAGKATLCGMHVLDTDSGEYNVAVTTRTLDDHETVMFEWAWRRQGLIVAPGNPKGITALDDLVRKSVRCVNRQEGAGSRLLLDHLFAHAELNLDAVTFTDSPARNETDVAMAVFSDSADAGLGIEAVVRQFGLDFVPLHSERYDLVVARPDYFEHAVQTLLEFARSERFAERAATLGGYDITGLGRIVMNHPKVPAL